MSIFSIGVSGLNSAQVALQTTSNNISNVHTPGYNRELTQFSEQPNGGGTQIVDVRRQFDHFVAAQRNSANSALTSLESQENQISQLDSLLADAEAGLAPMLQDFFSSLQDLAAAPADPAARQGVIGNADILTAQLRSLDTYMQDMQQGIEGQLNSEVEQINNTAAQIARLNQEISIASAKHGEAPNALLNQRDQLVSQLSERVDVSLHRQDGGSYTIGIGNGLPLVSGKQSYELSTMTAAAEPSRTTVGYVDSAGNEIELRESALGGGSLGGLLDFRGDTLDRVQNKVGQLAVSLALGFNAQHAAGTDLNGDPGSAMFSVATPTLYSHESNAGTATLSGQFDDPTGLTGADYDLEVSDAAAGEFQLTRRDDGSSFTATLDGADQLSFDGLVLSVDDATQLADGDRFRLHPTRGGAGQIDNLVQDTALLAAGQSASSGDNRNALALQDLQDEKLLGGEATLNQGYAALVSDVGNRSNIVKVNLSAQRNLHEQITMVQQSGSGVNLDEEAANLIRYQQYYQANAKVIEVGATVLDTLLRLRA